MNRRTCSKIVFPALLALCTWSACSSTRTTENAKQIEPEPLNEVALDSGASYYTEIDYDAGDVRLQPDDFRAISELVQKSMREGRIEQIKVVSFADQAYPNENQGKLPKAQRKIAESRNESIKMFLKDTYPSIDVKVYNMATRPDKLQEVFKTSDASTKKSFEEVGITSSNVVSKSVLFSVVRKNY